MKNDSCKIILIVAALFLSLLACNIPAVDNNTNTQEIHSTTLVNPTSSSTPLPIPELSTNTPTVTPVPITTFTPTPTIPQVMVSVNTNCREGPGIIYNWLDGLMVGDTAEIVQQAPEGYHYVIINRPNGPGNCWLWLEYATITGDITKLEIATIPPTPTLTLTSTPSSTPTPHSLFQGDWTIVIAETTYNISIIQNNNNISSSFSLTSGNILTIVGATNTEGKVVTGNFTESAGPGGNFTWYLNDNLTQFSGFGESGSTTFAWCGYRPGQSPPSPCQSP